jgi:tRNA modification GTPase
VRSAVRSLRGEFSRLIERLVQDLTELRALVEATLDFPEEDIDAADRVDAKRRLEQLRTQVFGALNQARAGSVLRTGLNVVLAGQPNVGKSSILNRLAGEELAIVAAIPGTTRDAVRQTLLLDGVPINVMDTAGLRQTADEIERLGMERTWRAIEAADLLLLVVDARSGVTALDEAIVGRLPQRLKRITVLNKVDLLAEAAACPGDVAAAVSARTGTGFDRLKALLLEAAGWQPGGEDVFMARERHVDALTRAGEHLEQAASAIDHGELMAESLRCAQRGLAAITGEFTADDLLGEIFARFCIGK